MNCKLCNQSVEDLSHAFIFSPYICDWWKTYLPIFDLLEHSNKCFLIVAEYILKNRDEEEGVKFFTITWSFWERRNKLIYDGRDIHPQVTIEKAPALKNAHKECSSMGKNRPQCV